MNRTLPLPWLLLVTCFCTAQNPATKPETLTWSAKDSQCGQFYTKGELFRGFETKPLAVIAGAVLDTGKQTQILVFFKNHTADAIDINPESFTLRSVAPQERNLAYVDPSKIAHSIEKRARIAAAFAGFGSGFAQQTGTITTDTGETATISMPDTQAQRETAASNRRMVANARDKGGRVVDTSMRRETLMADKELTGFVYFDRAKKGSELVLTLVVNGVAYEIPLTLPKTGR